MKLNRYYSLGIIEYLTAYQGMMINNNRIYQYSSGTGYNNVSMGVISVQPGDVIHLTWDTSIVGSYQDGIQAYASNSIAHNTSVTTLTQNNYSKVGYIISFDVTIPTGMTYLLINTTNGGSANAYRFQTSRQIGAITIQNSSKAGWDKIDIKKMSTTWSIGKTYQYTTGGEKIIAPKNSDYRGMYIANTIFYNAGYVNLYTARYWEVSPNTTYEIVTQGNNTSTIGNYLTWIVKCSNSDAVNSSCTIPASISSVYDSATNTTITTVTTTSTTYYLWFGNNNTTVQVTQLEVLDPTLSGNFAAGWYE